LNLFEFGFEFNRFPPVTGQTGPVNRNRSPAVTGNRLGNKTLVAASYKGAHQTQAAHRFLFFFFFETQLIVLGDR